jgi:CBS domain-containing protein
VVTDRDLVVRALAAGVDPAVALVSDHATRDPSVARPDWPVERALGTMARQQVGRLPVVEEDGRLVGIVTLGSLALRAAEKDETLETARKVSLRSAKAA